MRKRKKAKENRRQFALNVALYSVGAVASVVFVALIFSGSLQYAGNTGYQRAIASSLPTPVQQSVGLIDSSANFMRDVQMYLESNMQNIAKTNNAGTGNSIINNVSFIGSDRALVSYTDNGDNYLAEVVYAGTSGNIKVEGFILKVKNNIDYSGGVYGE